jgi:hypothetical protein
MKNFTLLITMLLLSAMAYSQTNPCPDILNHGVFNLAPEAPFTANNCTGKIVVFATGDVSSQKGLNIQVYLGTGTGGALLKDECFIVPASSPSTLYQTSHFNFPCTAQLTYVLTRRTASNGTCGGGSCGTTITVSGGPLPIKISSFFAKRTGNTVVLNWTSGSEINAKEFVIERNSGSGFVTVGTIPATNNSGGSSYSYTDNNNSKTVSQYRLKLVDKDQSFKLSEIRAVKGTAAVSDFTVFPNPSVGYAKISITDIAEATTVEVIDNAGRIVKTIELKNNNVVEINNLQNGIYLVRVINKASGEAVTKKLTVTN